MFYKSPITLQENIYNVGVLSSKLWGTQNVDMEEKYIFPHRSGCKSTTLFSLYLPVLENYMQNILI